MFKKDMIRYFYLKKTETIEESRRKGNRGVLLEKRAVEAQFERLV